VTRWGAADIGVAPGEVGLAGSPTQMLNVFQSPSTRKGEML
jgi:electron transfer flavoprotein alpha/beta subunit